MPLARGVQIRLVRLPTTTTVQCAHEAQYRPSAARAERLRHEAERLGRSPEELARAVVADVLTVPDEDFQKAAAHVVRKFEELYRRLA